MKFIIGSHYLIRQIYCYGSDSHDDIMVLKLIRRATPNENSTYGGESGMWGLCVKDDELKYFEEKEVISSIQV